MSQVNSNTVITKVQRKENSFRLEVTGVIVKEGGSVLSLLNEGDARFDNNSKRYAWMKVEPGAVEKYFGVPAEQMMALPIGGEIALNIVGPTIAGLPLNIEVVEDHTPENDYEVQNWDKSAKQVEISQNVLKSSRMKKSAACYDAIGERGYFTANGKLIFSHVRVVTGTPKNVFVEDYQIVTKAEAANLLAAGVQMAAETAPVAETAKADTEI